MKQNSRTYYSNKPSFSSDFYLGTYLSLPLKLLRTICVIVSCFSLSVFLLTALSANASAKEFSPIKWVDLIPQLELDVLSNPPESLNAIPHGSPQGGLDALSNSIDQAIGQSQSLPSPEEQLYSAALTSTNIKAEFDQKNIRIPGFIVPVEYGDDQVVTEFFLVPYFGACIHVPPPPPNQIIYVKYPKGLALDVLYDPFWIEGQLLVELTESDLATSAYGMTAANIEKYVEYQP